MEEKKLFFFFFIQANLFVKLSSKWMIHSYFLSWSTQGLKPPITYGLCCSSTTGWGYFYERSLQITLALIELITWGCDRTVTYPQSVFPLTQCMDSEVKPGSRASVGSAGQTPWTTKATHVWTSASDIQPPADLLTNSTCTPINP